MKKNITKTLALIAVLCGLNAFAATPVAVWDGDFSTLTKGGVTLNANGNEMQTGNKGIKITKTSSDASNGVLLSGFETKGVTIIAEYTNLTIGDDFVSLITVGSAADNNNQDLAGFCSSNNVCAGVYQSGYWTNTTTAASVPSNTTSPNRIAFVQDHLGNTGAKAYANGNAGAWTKVYDASGLRASNTALKFACIGGISRQGSRYASQKVVPATGMVISRIAVFTRVLTQDEIAAYHFPSEFVYWNGDLANNSVKGKFTMTAGSNCSIADGKATITKASSGNTTGLVISWPAPTTDPTSFTSKDLTVIVKYSGLDWASEDTAHAFISALTATSGSNYLVGGKKSTTQAMAATGYGDKLKSFYTWPAIPTEGIMMATFTSGYSSTNGKGVRFFVSAKNADGTYEPFRCAAYRNVTDMDKNFYGVMIGGSSYSTSYFHRPGMVIEGVAIVPGSALKFGLPDEYWSQTKFGFVTSSTQLLASNISLETVSNALVTAVAAGGSMSVRNSVASGTVPAYTLTDNKLSKITMNEFAADNTYIKGVGVDYTQNGNDVYYKSGTAKYKSGRDTVPTKGMTFSIGTFATSEDADGYSFRDFTVNVPFSKKASVSGAVNWSAIADRPTQPADVAVVKATAATTITFDEAATSGILRFVSDAAVTLKYTDVTKAITANYIDMTMVKGGVTFDLSAIPGVDLAKYAVAGAPYSFWLARGSFEGAALPTVTLPTAPSGYTFKVETTDEYGVRVIVTAPSTAKFGSVSVNVRGETDTLDASSSFGLFPVVGSNWGYQKGADAVTQDGVTFTPYISGTDKTFGTENNNTGITDNKSPKYIFRGNNKDHDDSHTIGYTITGLSKFSKYRVIVYNGTDTANIYFAPMVINGVAYCGPTTGTTGGATVKGSSALKWGHTGADKNSNDMAEGVNAVISDVLTGDEVTIRAIRAYKAQSTRATMSAIQIVEVGVVAKIGDKSYDSLAAAESAVQSGETITLMRATSEAFSTAKTFTMAFNSCVYSGTLTVNNGGDVTLSGATATTLTGSIAIAEGGVVENTAAFDRGVYRNLLNKVSGNGTLKVAVGSGTVEAHTYNEKVALTVNVNVEHSGTGVMRFVGEFKSYDTLTVSSGKTMTFENGTIWAVRNTFLLDGAMVAKIIQIGHESSGTYPGKIQINNGGLLKTEGVLFKNYGGSQNSVLELQTGGTLEFTSDLGSAITKVDGATYSVNLNGGTLKADASSWHVGSDIAMTIADGTFDAAEGKILAIAGPISGSGNVSITGAGEVILNGVNTDTGTYTVASGASLTLGTGRTQTIVGTSAGTVTITLTPEEKATLDGGNSAELLAVSGGAFAGTLKAVDSSGAAYEINEPTISSGGKFVVTKKEGARMSPFVVTNPTNETWTIAGWMDSSSPALVVRPEDWDNKVSANVTVEAGQEKALTTDRALTLGTLTLGNAGTLMVSANGANAITADTLAINNTGTLTVSGNAISTLAIDDTASTGATTIGFDIGALPLTAGANTILTTAGTGAYTIPANKKLTVKSGTVSEANVSNSGTLNFLGGDADNPIVYDSNGGASKNTGKLTIAAGSYMKMLSHNQTKVMTVSGAGAATSKFEIYGNGSSGQGMKKGTQFRNLTLVVKNFLNSNYLWVEQSGALDETVVLQANSRTIFNDYDYTVGGLTGGGTVKAQQSARVLTIKPSANYEYTGTSDVTFTIAASDCTQTLSGTYTGALTVNEGGKVTLTGSANPSSIANAGTVTLKGIAALAGIANAGKVVFDVPANTTNFVAYAITGAGSIEIVGGGTVIFKESSGVTPNTTIIETSGKALFAKTVDINNLGKYTPVAPYTTANVVLFDQGGNVINATVVGDHLEYTWDVEGKNCWWDYEFNGNVKSVGTDTTTMTAEGTTPYYNEGNTALWVGHATHYRGVSDGYPYEFTAVLQGKMVNTEKHVEIGFGSTGNSGISVAIACGNPENDEVELIISQGFDVQKTVLMSVPNAYDADHLYAFVVKTVNEGGTDKTKVIVYLDGVEWDSYTFSSKILLAAGFQIGSVHNGVPTGYKKATTVNEKSFLNFLRVYKTVLSNEAMTRYAAKYPYKSTNGNASRTFAAATANWTSDGAWSVTPFEGAEYTSNMPPAKAIVTIDASTASTVTMNLDESATYEQFKVQGNNAITLKTGGTVKPTVSGMTTVGANLTVDGDAIGFGNVMVTEGKTLTFDFTDFPFTNYFANATINLTGKPSGAGTVTSVIPDLTGTGRTAVFQKNPDSQHYELVITVDTTIHPFVYTINEGAETGVWTWGNDVADESAVLAQSSATIKKAGTGTQQFVGKNKYTYEVDGGTLKFTNTVTDVTSTITINEGATFDMNGLIDSLYNVVLNGGTLANYGKTISFNKKQLTSITLTKDSSVATVSGGASDSGNFCFISAGYATNTLDLAGHTLTKKGDAQFVLVNTVVSNGAVVVEAGQLRINAPDSTVNHTVFTNATLAIKENAELYVGRSSLTIGEITGEGGTIEVVSGYTLSPFTLKGSLKLTGNGNYGTITMAEGAVADVGTRHNLTFAGKGSVKAKLTGNYEPGDQVTLFTAASGATTGLAELKDKDGNGIDASYYTFANGVVTFKKEAKAGTTIYFTLKQAIEDTSATAVELIADVTGGEEITVSRAISFDGGTNILSNVTFTFSGSGALSLNTGCIGIGYTKGMVLAGSCCRFVEGVTNSWAKHGPSDHSIATLSAAVRPDYIYEFVPTAFVPDPTKDEVLIPVADAKDNDAGAIKLKGEWVKTKTGSDDPQVQAQKLNTQEKNGMRKWQNDILGLTGAESTSKPVVATPQQTAPVGYIDFKMGGCNVDTTSGATVKYKVLTAATPGAEVWSQTGGISNYTETVRVELPASGVKYYKLEVIPETSESVKEEPKPPQVTINGKGYPSLAAAIGDAEAGDTLVVLGDLETGADVNVAKDMTIDMNELTVAGMLNVKSGATLTVCGVGEFDGPITVEDGGKLDFKNGKHIS